MPDADGWEILSSGPYARNQHTVLHHPCDSRVQNSEQAKRLHMRSCRAGRRKATRDPVKEALAGAAAATELWDDTQPEPTPRRAPAAPVQLPAEATGLQAMMDEHKAGFDAYVAARKADDAAAKETNADAYRAYKKAYTALLAMKKAARDG
jgi:hypothetical protein